MNWLTIASVWKLKNVYCNWSEHWKYLNIQISNCWNIIKTFLCSVLLTQYVFCSERVRVRVRPSEEQSTGSRPNGWNGDYGSASRFDGWLISSIQFPSYGMGWPPALPTIVMMPSHRARLEGILLSRLYIAFSSPSAAPYLTRTMLNFHGFPHLEGMWWIRRLGYRLLQSVSVSVSVSISVSVVVVVVAVVNDSIANVRERKYLANKDFLDHASK